MRVLMVFVDMLRPNRFGSYNKNVKSNQVDEIFNNLGGVLYTNCFSPAPDTPRSMACFYTGKLPMENGCDTRVKWPGKFIDKSAPNIFDLFRQNNFVMNFFSNPNERQGGLFPPGIEKVGLHNEDYDLQKFLGNFKLSKDQLLFVSIPDYHWALQDWGYTKKGEKIAITETEKSLKIIFDNLDKDDFDHIFIFSDHGFKFNAQLRFEEDYKFLNRDRSNIFLLHRKRENNDLSLNEKLCSIQDLTDTISDIFGYDSNFSILGKSERDYVIVEDHKSVLAPKVNQNVDIWGLVKKNEIYVRTLVSGVTLRDDGMILEGINNSYDNILKNESQFGRYLDENEKVFQYHELILAQTSFMNGSPRTKESFIRELIRKYEILKDHLRLFYKGHL